MMIVIGDGVLNDPGQWMELEGLLDEARRKRCYLDAFNPQSVSSNPWLNQTTLSRKQQWHDATTWAVKDAAIYRLRKLVVDIPCGAGCHQPSLSPADAQALIARPTSIWVENARNDRRFLLSMMHDDQKAMYYHWERERIIEFVNGGGLGEMRKIMEEQRGRGTLSSRTSWAFFDSDAESPGDRSRDATAAATFCESENIPYCCLCRRAIENYLPKKALYGWANSASDRQSRRQRNNKIDAYYRLSAVQRHHFHLKSGFSNSPPGEVPNLFLGISGADRDTLMSGIDRNISALYDVYENLIYEWAIAEGFDAELQKAIDEMTDWIRVPYA